MGQTIPSKVQTVSKASFLRYQDRNRIATDGLVWVSEPKGSVGFQGKGEEQRHSRLGEARWRRSLTRHSTTNGRHQSRGPRASAGQAQASVPGQGRIGTTLICAHEASYTIISSPKELITQLARCTHRSQYPFLCITARHGCSSGTSGSARGGVPDLAARARRSMHRQLYLGGHEVSEQGVHRHAARFRRLR